MVDQDPYPLKDDELSAGDYQVITHARDGGQAERLRDLLVDHDIEAVVAEEDADGPWAAGEGVAVLVPSEDLDEAREILDDIDLIEDLDVVDDDFDDEDEDELDDQMQPLDAEGYLEDDDDGDELEEDL